MVDFSRLESSKVLRKGDEGFDSISDGRDTVTCYDLTIDGHPSFAATTKDLIVHNCIDTEETSTYNTDEYYLSKIGPEMIEDVGGEVLQLLDAPASHRKHKRTWIGADIGFCVDEETEIFTKRGWLTQDQIDDDDQTLTINEKTGLSEWNNIDHVYYGRNTKAPLMHFKGQSFDALTTTHHRWLAKKLESRIPGKMVWETSETLNTKSAIPYSAPRGDALTRSVVEDEFVEVLSWFFSEGHFTPHGKSISFGQSSTANPANVDRIKSVMRSLYGDPTGLKHGPSRVGEGPYSEITRPDGMVYWQLSQEESVPYLVVLNSKEKDISVEFLTLLTVDQLNLFVEVSILADGWVTKSGRKCFEQWSVLRIKTYESVLALAGIASSTTRSMRDGKYRYHTTMLQSPHVRPVQAAQGCKQLKSEIGMTISHLKKDTILWCPSTKNKNWLARRNGSVYFTGNTVDPTEILVFAEEVPKKSEPSVLKLISRYQLKRVSNPHQVDVMQWLIDFYRPQAFSLDRTGVGLPLFQELQDRVSKNPGLKRQLDTIKGYNFSEKIIVGFDDTVDFDPDTEASSTDAAMKKRVLEYSSDTLRELVDATRLKLPWDKELISEFQGETYSIKKNATDMYGRKNYSKTSLHTLDAARMAVLGWKQYSIEQLLSNQVEEKYEYPDIVFGDF